MVPSLFVCHGAPTLAIENNEYTQFLKNLGEQIKPKAIVLFTAHWETEITTISYKDDIYETIYDFSGFSDELYQVKYPAQGSTRFAKLVEEKIQAEGIPTMRDGKRGLDHGSWVVLHLMYPNADLPVIQVSVNPFLPPEEQFKIGEALRELGNEDILIIGSGGTSHNLGTINWDQNEPESWTVQFDDWLIKSILNNDLEALFNYERLAPHAQLAVPRPEHFVPLFIALGSGRREEPTLRHRSYAFGTLSYVAFEF